MSQDNGNILIVEDCPDDEEFMLIALEKSGVEKSIVILRDGADAADYMAAVGMYSERGADDVPQNIFLDCKLPKLTGLQVLERIRVYVSTASLPDIVMTTSMANSIAEESFRLGASGLVHKSLGLDDFADAVKQQIENRCGPTC